MKALTSAEQAALLDVVALVSAAREPDDGPDAEPLNEVLDAVVGDLGRASGLALAIAFGVVASRLLDRLASASYRGAEELWQEIAHEITMGAIKGGEQG
ncbi:hypothetical protein SAMN04489713_104266 [Actinomadura madurae]|uniref:Uncharacterized protein n=1 Tax=Actinomadura madurae TaxID=1993 RepID=A0A1I5ESN4_9ACTN|nr:hypothetical protein [Actinomadura madurae]SFO14535.1 hypothetical protein SAMN04489713_104266 [Actinomadura madurae]